MRRVKRFGFFDASLRAFGAQAVHIGIFPGHLGPVTDQIETFSDHFLTFSEQFPTILNHFLTISWHFLTFPDPFLTLSWHFLTISWLFPDPSLYGWTISEPFRTDWNTQTKMLDWTGWDPWTTWLLEHRLGGAQKGMMNCLICKQIIQTSKAQRNQGYQICKYFDDILLTCIKSGKSGPPAETGWMAGQAVDEGWGFKICSKLLTAPHKHTWGVSIFWNNQAFSGSWNWKVHLTIHQNLWWVNFSWILLAGPWKIVGGLRSAGSYWPLTHSSLLLWPLIVQSIIYTEIYTIYKTFILSNVIEPSLNKPVFLT